VTVTRRSFVKRGLLGGALLTIGGVGGLSARSTVMVEPLGPLKALDAKSYSIFSAVAARLVPQGDGFPSARSAKVVESIDETLTLLHPADLQDLKRLLWLFEGAVFGVLFDMRPTTFTGSRPEAQDRALIAWRDSKISVRRTGYVAVRSLVMSAYFGSEQGYEAVGYPGPPEILPG
jgi:hypothetical protein